MCGGGSVAVECLVSHWPHNLSLNGDMHDLAIQRSCDNLGQHPKASKRAWGVCQWDVTRLPIRSGVVDVVVTDMAWIVCLCNG